MLTHRTGSSPVSGTKKTLTPAEALLKGFLFLPETADSLNISLALLDGIATQYASPAMGAEKTFTQFKLFAKGFLFLPETADSLNISLALLDGIATQYASSTMDTKDTLTPAEAPHQGLFIFA